jgi:hypothetical protein
VGKRGHFIKTAFYVIIIKIRFENFTRIFDFRESIEVFLMKMGNFLGILKK